MASTLILAHTPASLQADQASSTSQLQRRLAGSFYEEETDSGLGFVQIRVIGFGLAGTTALTLVAKYPVLGLSFVDHAQTEFVSSAPEKMIFSAIDRLLGRAHALVLLVDESDAAQTKQATLVSNRAKTQGLLTIGVALAAGLGTSDAASTVSNDFTTSVHSFIRLVALDAQHTTSGTAAVLHSLTAGLATLCNVQGYVGVDYEDVRTILQWPARLAVGVGIAGGSDRARVATLAAMANAQPTPLGIHGAQRLLVIVSAPPNALRLSECKEAMNTVRGALSKDAHCIFGTMHSDLLSDQWGGPASDQMQVTVMATSP